MGYRAIKKFLDLTDNYREYNVGDEFPHVGLKVSEARLEQLLTGKNRRKEPLIEYVEEEPQETITDNNIEEEIKEDALDKVDEKAAKEAVKPKKGRKKNAD